MMLWLRDHEVMDTKTARLLWGVGERGKGGGGLGGKLRARFAFWIPGATGDVADSLAASAFSSPQTQTQPRQLRASPATMYWCSCSKLEAGSVPLADHQFNAASFLLSTRYQASQAHETGR